MTARWRRALGVLVAALLGVGSVVATIGPAEAASCKGSNCTGKDPGVQGCLGGDSTIDTADWATASPPYAEVLLRYNSSCKAMWAKGFSTPWYAYDIKIVKRRASDDGPVLRSRDPRTRSDVARSGAARARLHRRRRTRDRASCRRGRPAHA